MLPIQNNITLEQFQELAGTGRLHGLYNIPDTWYFAAPALNSSSLKEFKISPLNYKLHKDIPISPTDAMTFGSAAHCKVLEPDRFNERYVVSPRFDGSKSKKKANGGCKEDWDAFKKEDHGDKRVIEFWDGQRLETMDFVVKSHPSYKKMLDGTYKEVSAFWNCKKTGIPLKARFDMIGESFGVVDYKTTSKGVLNYQVEKYVCDGYYLQMTFYLKAVREMPELASIANIGSWLFQNTNKGHECAHTYVTKFPYRKIDQMITEFAECQRNKSFPTKYYETFEMELPRWIMD